MYYDDDDDFYRQVPVPAFFPYAPVASVAPVLPVPPPINAPYCVWKRYWKRYWQYYNWWRYNAGY